MKKEMTALVAAAALVLVFVAIMGAPWVSPRHRRFKKGDRIPLYASKVGPFRNPSETYRYFDLPFCPPAVEHVNEKNKSLSEALVGSNVVESAYELQFQVDKDSKSACKKLLTKEDVARFRNAVKSDYYLQMYFDELPVLAFFGKTITDESKYFLYRSWHFNIFYNNDSVIEITLHTNPNQNALADITDDKEIEIEFLYTVKWSETSTPFKNRMDRYMPSSLSHYWQFHLFSTTISCSLVLFLTIVLATILMRVLKNDFIKYARDDHLIDDQGETGWKYIHGDVFRFPKSKSLFAACLGSGTQLLILAIFIFILLLLGVSSPFNRGSLFTATIVIYALTSGIAGYTSTTLYGQFEGANWIKNLLLNGCISYGPLFLTLCFLNSIATVYDIFAAVRWSNFVLIFSLWTMVTSPLLVLGGIVGKNRKKEFQAPCRTSKCPREIPILPWYRGIIPQMTFAGLLPFTAIYFELYYTFASLFGHRIYSMYNILFTVFIILLVVTAFVTVALTYFQLAAEDHHWWWRSFLNGGSTALFVYGYCFYYYLARSDMSGFLQTSFFFVYMACVCYGIFLMLGTVGFLSSWYFVHHIYQSIKCE